MVERPVLHHTDLLGTVRPRTLVGVDLVQSTRAVSAARDLSLFTSTLDMNEQQERRVGIETLAAEVAAIHRENERRDLIIRELANDIKELLALANKSKGGLWVGMSLASIFGAIASWVISHITFKGPM